MTDQFKTTITQNSTNSSLFTQDFAKIIKRYKKHCSYAKRLLEETDKSYSEINYRSVLTSGALDIYVKDYLCILVFSFRQTF